jgi:hypothetical protein
MTRGATGPDLQGGKHSAVTLTKPISTDSLETLLQSVHLQAA